jgi:hypothetical protein
MIKNESGIKKTEELITHQKCLWNMGQRQEERIKCEEHKGWRTHLNTKKKWMRTTMQNNKWQKWTTGCYERDK